MSPFIYAEQHHPRVSILSRDSLDEREILEVFAGQVGEALRQTIVRVRDFDQTSDRRPFSVMELIEGRDLRALLREQGKRPLAEMIELGLQICSALALLHEHGVIHRDLTPRNVIVDERSTELRVKLIDFGISKLTSLFYAEECAYMTPPEQRLHTRTGRILGTPGYTAPEVADEPPSPQQDIFSLGVVLFELATGKRPPAAWLRSIPDDVGWASTSAKLGISAPMSSTNRVESLPCDLWCLVEQAGLITTTPRSGPTRASQSTAAPSTTTTSGRSVATFTATSKRPRQRAASTQIEWVAPRLSRRYRPRGRRSPPSQAPRFGHARG